MLGNPLIEKAKRIKDPLVREIIIAILDRLDRTDIGEKLESLRKELIEFKVETRENFKQVWLAIGELSKKIDRLTESQKQMGGRLDTLTGRVDQLTDRVDHLTGRVDQLTDAQKRTEKRLDALTDRVDHLTDRVDHLTKRVNQLTDAQKRTEKRLDALTDRVDQLTDAQKRMEGRLDGLTHRVDQLTDAQKKTEERLDQLTESYKEMDQKLTALIEEHKKTREQLGGLSHTVGYILEDRAFIGLPKLLEEKFNIKLVDLRKREYIEIAPGKYREVNILGKGVKDGREIYIIGECKSQLKSKDVDAFLELVETLDRLLPGEKFLLLITYQAPIHIKQYVQEKGIKLIFSHELPLMLI